MKNYKKLQVVANETRLIILLLTGLLLYFTMEAVDELKAKAFQVNKYIEC